MNIRQTILLTIVSLSALSCLKKPNFDADNGPVVPTATIQNAIVQAWGNADPASMKVGEFIYLEKDWIISTAQPRTVLQESKTVAKIETNVEDPNYNDYTIIQQIREINEQVDSKPVTNERTIQIAKSIQQTQQKLTTMAQPSAMSVEIILNLLNICVSGKDWNVTCHNLTSWETTEAPPSLVATRENCGDVPNCQILKRHVAWDLVLKSWDEKNKGYIQQKIRYTVSMSPDVPFMARIMDFCYQGVGDFNGQRFPVTICDSIKNFKYDQNSK